MATEPTPSSAVASATVAPLPTAAASPDASLTPSESPDELVISDIPVVERGEVLFRRQAGELGPCVDSGLVHVELLATTLEGADPRLITTLCRFVHGGPIALSPDGRYLAAAHLRGPVVLDLVGGQRFDYGTNREDMSVQGIAWSADSSAITYSELFKADMIFTRVLKMPPADYEPETLLEEGPESAEISGGQYAGTTIQRILPDGRLLYDTLWRNIPRLIDPQTSAESLVTDELGNAHMDIFDVMEIDGTMRVLYRPFRGLAFDDGVHGALYLAELGPDDRLINTQVIGRYAEYEFYYGRFLTPDTVVGRVMLEEYDGIASPSTGGVSFLATWDLNNLAAGFTPITPLEMEGYDGLLQWDDFVIIDETRLIGVESGARLFLVYMDGRPPTRLMAEDQYGRGPILVPASPEG